MNKTASKILSNAACSRYWFSSKLFLCQSEDIHIQIEFSFKTTFVLLINSFAWGINFFHSPHFMIYCYWTAASTPSVLLILAIFTKHCRTPPDSHIIYDDNLNHQWCEDRVRTHENYYNANLLREIACNQSIQWVQKYYYYGLSWAENENSKFASIIEAIKIKDHSMIVLLHTAFFFWITYYYRIRLLVNTE